MTEQQVRRHVKGCAAVEVSQGNPVILMAADVDEAQEYADWAEGLPSHWSGTLEVWLPPWVLPESAVCV